MIRDNNMLGDWMSRQWSGAMKQWEKLNQKCAEEAKDPGMVVVLRRSQIMDLLHMCQWYTEDRGNVPQNYLSVISYLKSYVRKMGHERHGK